MFVAVYRLLVLRQASDVFVGTAAARQRNAGHGLRDREGGLVQMQFHSQLFLRPGLCLGAPAIELGAKSCRLFVLAQLAINRTAVFASTEVDTVGSGVVSRVTTSVRCNAVVEAIAQIDAIAAIPCLKG
jgi:hypothetical protein